MLRPTRRLPTKGLPPAPKARNNTIDPTAVPDSSVLGSRSVTATWAVPRQEHKHGAGLLFFAYGAQVTLQHFLVEAGNAALSFRHPSANITIAVVTNNETVDPSIFDIHIKPRRDLLFAGDPCPYGPKGCNAKARPRQWAPRLYYLALSPFEVTWALDSNVACCHPQLAAAFLHSALRTRMWSFDIATANQGVGSMYPHNWNIMYRWTRATSDLMRDWLMLQLRRGLGTDDQGTLFAAEQRQRASGGLRVGQMPTPYAAAYYSAFSKRGQFYPRITRPLEAEAVLIHTRNNDAAGRRGWCAAFNEAKGVRRQVMCDSEKGLKNTKLMHSVRSSKACRLALGTNWCPFGRMKGERDAEDKIFDPPLATVGKLKLAW